MSILALLLLQLLAVAGALGAFRRLAPADEASIRPPASVIVMCAAAAIFVFAISKPALLFWDFREAYYPAGRAVLSGPAALAPLFEKSVLGFVNLPIMAYLFAPFALLNLKVAAVLFLLLGLGTVLATWFLLVRLAGLVGNERWVLLLLFAAFGPLHYSLREGNTAHTALFAIVLALYFLRAGRDMAAGVFLSIAALLKLPLMLFGIYFLLRRSWTVALTFIAVCGGAALLSLAVFGWDIQLRWIELCLRHGSDPIGAWNNQSIVAFLVRLFSAPDMLENWKTQSVGAVQHAVGVAAALLLMIVAVLACLRRPSPGADPRVNQAVDDLEFQLVLVLALVTTPLAWTHYYTWLLLPIAFFLNAQSPIAASPAARWPAWIATFMVMPIATLIPYAGSPLAALQSKLIVSHVLIGGLIWFGLLVWARVRITSGVVAANAPSPA